MPADSTPLSPEPAPLRVSVLTCAFNEEANIGCFLEACLSSTGPSFVLAEIVVVASGCTDKTVEIVRRYAQRDSRVRHLEEPARRGKASALRLGLSATRGEIIVVEGADTMPAEGAIEALVAPLRDPRVGLVCGQPRPAGGAAGFVVRMATTLWAVHHRVSQIIPKAGEGYAIRQQAMVIPADIQDDDTYVGVTAATGGAKSVYAEQAIIYNRVPSTAPDYLRQRWRINRQILGLRRSSGILSSTWNPGTLARAVIGYWVENPRSIAYLAALSVSEMAVRTAALASRIFRPSPLVKWAPIISTKGAIRTGPQPPALRTHSSASEGSTSGPIDRRNVPGVALGARAGAGREPGSGAPSATSPAPYRPR
jgi:biofilm PGA synthesis N-glycosyltransferase PgaC